MPSMRAGLLSVAVVLLGCDPVGPAHRPPGALDACRSATLAPETSISSYVERLNQLPAAGPSCLLASLARPLDVVATTSITSAQPALNRQSPRLFLLNGHVALSFVPAGDGAHLVEFGQWMTATRTLKGEVELPRTAELALDAPLTRVRFGTPATTCGLCHREEAADPSSTGYSSLAFRPSPRTLVPLAELTAEHERCTREEDASERCLMFHALFDFGAVRAGAFDAQVTTFTD
jgi:cytochrome c553